MKFRSFLSTLLLFFFSLSHINGQDSTEFNLKNEEGQKIGRWKGYHEDGSLRYKGQFENGQPFGTFRHYFPDGKLQSILMYKTPSVAYVTHYYSTGEKLAKGKYINQKKDSTWLTYGAKNKVVEQGDYDMGKKVGIWKTFYLNGAISAEMNYNNDVKDGSYIMYFENGKVKDESTFVNGKLNGLSTLYDSQGKKVLKGIYKDGVRDKRWIYYDEKQQVEKVLVYENGKLTNPEVLDKIEEDLEKYKDNRKDVLEFEDLRGRISYE